MAPDTPTDPMQAAETSPGGHAWHSPRYVRQWMADKEGQAEVRRAQFDLLADCLPYAQEATIHILDIGAGWGPLSSHLLARFPASRVTLLDYSEAMLAEARVRLAADTGRTRYLVGDLTRPGALDEALQATGTRFDAVVASCCFHNIDPADRVRTLYREIRAVVAPGGCFLNLDTVGTDAPILRGVTHRGRVERLRRRRLTQTGTLPSFVDTARELDGHRQGRYEGSHGPLPEHRSLWDHLSWLQQAGFDEVEGFWRQDDMTLIGGYVAGPEATP